MRAAVAAVSLALSLLAAGPVHAQAGAPRDFRFALTAGLTGGGDKLGTVTFTDGTTQSIRAGGLVQIGAGFLWQPSGSPLALQTTFNYHVDSVNASNGDLRFSRYPIEVLGFYTGLGPWRFGGGARFVLDPTLTVDVPGTNLTVDFEDTIGAVLEAGYRFGSAVTVNLRYTVEKYKPKAASNGAVVTNTSVSGDSVGLNVVFSF
jgi:hypothetical protein